MNPVWTFDSHLSYIREDNFTVTIRSTWTTIIPKSQREARVSPTDWKSNMNVLGGLQAFSEKWPNDMTCRSGRLRHW